MAEFHISGNTLQLKLDIGYIGMYKHMTRSAVSQTINSILHNFDPQSYNFDVAVSLIDFANRNELFGRKLKKLINEKYNATAESPASEFILQNRLTPLTDVENAERRAIWLSNRLLQNKKDPAGTLLIKWANSQTAQDPKALIVGIVGVAIPGITLGLIKKHVSLPCIFSKEILFKTKLDLASVAVNVCTGLLQAALNEAQKDFYKIEPDISDWFFGRRSVAYYYTSAKQLKVVLQQIKEMQAPVYVVQEGNEIMALSFTPALNSEFYRKTWRLNELVLTN
jgi:hypothetical protein